MSVIRIAGRTSVSPTEKMTPCRNSVGPTGSTRRPQIAFAAISTAGPATPVWISQPIDFITK